MSEMKRKPLAPQLTLDERIIVEGVRAKVGVIWDDFIVRNFFNSELNVEFSEQKILDSLLKIGITLDILGISEDEIQMVQKAFLSQFEIEYYEDETPQKVN